MILPPLCEGAAREVGTNQELWVESVPIDKDGRAQCLFCNKRIKVNNDGTFRLHTKPPN